MCDRRLSLAVRVQAACCRSSPESCCLVATDNHAVLAHVGNILIAWEAWLLHGHHSRTGVFCASVEIILRRRAHQAGCRRVCEKSPPIANLNLFLGLTCTPPVVCGLCSLSTSSNLVVLALAVHAAHRQQMGQHFMFLHGHHSRPSCSQSTSNMMFFTHVSQVISASLRRALHCAPPEHALRLLHLPWLRHDSAL